MRHVFRFPDVGEGIAEAEIVEYLVNVGDVVKADQPVVRVETDKAVVELPSPVAGRVLEIPHKPGAVIKVGEPLLILEAEGPAAEYTVRSDETARPPAPPVQAAPIPAPTPAPATRAGAPILATPHTRRLARELSVEITSIVGSGPRGRITDDDVRGAAAKAKVEQPAPKAPTAASVQVPATAGFDFEKYGPTLREPLRGIRKRTAEVMVRSVSTIPHVTHFDQADVTELMTVLDQLKPYAETRGAKLTVLSFLAKAAVDALKRFPSFNSSLDESTGEIVFKHYYNIGFATDTEAGLMVPVVRDADRKSIMEIASGLQELANKARDRSIEIDDMRGGTFTITNVGAIGGMWATPIIVHPEVAILCSVRARKVPVVRDDEIVIRTVMPL
ncbi:MAG: dihydrolipoamide acetyltransferase family protein, partial [Pseudomonadota bacterium]